MTSPKPMLWRFLWHRVADGVRSYPGRNASDRSGHDLRRLDRLDL